MQQGYGDALKIGDTIEFLGQRLTITALRPYTGPLAVLAGARVATFAQSHTGMTIAPDASFSIFA